MPSRSWSLASLRKTPGCSAWLPSALCPSCHPTLPMPREAPGQAVTSVLLCILPHWGLVVAREQHLLNGMFHACSHRGWMQWGLSTAAGYLGYLPRQAPLSQVAWGLGGFRASVCDERYTLCCQLPVFDASSICAIRCTLPTVQALPKPPTEAEMQELLRAMDLDGPAPGVTHAEHSQDMRFTFDLTVSNQSSCSCYDSLQYEGSDSSCTAVLICLSVR